MPTPIAQTIHLLEEFLAILDNAYWESTATERKDTLYDIITVFHIELRELSKLSIEDHYLSYEAITSGARSISPKLRKLQNQLDDWALRTTTAEQLRHQLPKIAHALTRES